MKQNKASHFTTKINSIKVPNNSINHQNSITHDIPNNAKQESVESDDGIASNISYDNKHKCQRYQYLIL